MESKWHFEYSDSGLNAITIEVYDSNTNTLVASTLSTNGGNPYEAGYFNFSLPPGNYKLFIPPFAGSGYGGYVPTFYHSNPVGSTCYPSCNCVDNDLLSTWWTVEIVLDFNTPCVDLGLRESTPLPITLLAFSAITQSSKSKITFTTASEANNAGFDIERSAVC
ncbi:MAG: hypothetical protein IPG00_10720 [Saprospiraceae bacterium]|nr:hypothetical protein [Saprospiraceae bacterium]